MRPVLYLSPREGVHRNSPDWRPNLGQENTQLAQQSASLAATAATTTATLLASIGTIAAGTVPLVGAIAGAGLVLAGLLIKEFSGCGQSCTLTSDAADQIEKALQQNKDAYFAIPDGQRTKSMQAAALANFDNTWAKLVQYCGNPSFGSAGQRCVTDRERGACKIKDAQGNCFNWFLAYRDPIANDASVVPDVVPNAVSQVKSAVDQIFGGTGGAPLNLKPLVLIGGALLLWMALS